MLEFRFNRPTMPRGDAWQRLPIEPRHLTALGISFRTPQVASLGLELESALRELLAYPFHRIRLGAYWNRIEPTPGVFDTRELDFQVDAAERAGKQIVLCVGALKTFGYPEFFVPRHRLRHPLPEHTLIRPAAFPDLMGAATEFLSRIVERYRAHTGIVAWQVEHEAVDPLGVEHSWRLAAEFVKQEVDVVRQCDPARPILMNGFLPASLPVRLAQWWQTRDQGDSLSVAQQLADIVGLDYYPRHALVGLGGRTLYLDGAGSRWGQSRRRNLFAWSRRQGRRLMISEGQAEPWEAVTTPPNPPARWMFSCPPDQLIATYNQCLRWAREASTSLDAYLFWGAEYWLLRNQSGDPTYLQAFARILAES
ncbi:MAG TPA: beta-galactosidase [Chloroflexota bacterium]|nr:beta-galactosidase [Chloroflexota bacterium]